ncbi:hypothetical protein R69927_07704 [Paraburkholderia domus]|nr:hypothetical protein R69927_07704 [Paraburkholderia domus]
MHIYFDEQAPFDRHVQAHVRSECSSRGWLPIDDACLRFVGHANSGRPSHGDVNASTLVRVASDWLTGNAVLESDEIQRMRANAVIGSFGLFIGHRQSTDSDASDFAAALRLRRLAGFVATFATWLACSPPPPSVLVINFPERVRHVKPIITRAACDASPPGSPIDDTRSDIAALVSGAISITALTVDDSSKAEVLAWLRALIPQLCACVTAVPTVCCNACVGDERQLRG